MAEQRSERELEKHLKTLKGQRTWKKGAITKRIKKLESMVNDGGRRTLIRAAVDGLLTVFDELNLVCASIAAMSEEVDDLNSVEENAAILTVARLIMLMKSEVSGKQMRSLHHFA